MIDRHVAALREREAESEPSLTKGHDQRIKDLSEVRNGPLVRRLVVTGDSPDQREELAGNAGHAPRAAPTSLLLVHRHNKRAAAHGHRFTGAHAEARVVFHPGGEAHFEGARAALGVGRIEDADLAEARGPVAECRFVEGF